MADRPSDGNAAREAARVLCVPASETIVIVFSGAIVGILTHWVKRSRACPGVESCPPAAHRGNSTWYGYAPVRLYQSDRRLWVPRTLEVTENLEELLRSYDLAGQVWALHRQCEGRRRSGRVEGAYLETRTDAALVTPFDVRPAVQRLYHQVEIAFGVKNPTPPRVMLPVAAAAAPIGWVETASADPRPPTAEQLEALRRMAGRGGNPTDVGQRRRTPQASSNGKAHP